MKSLVARPSPAGNSVTVHSRVGLDFTLKGAVAPDLEEAGFDHPVERRTGGLRPDMRLDAGLPHAEADLAVVGAIAALHNFDEERTRHGSRPRHAADLSR